MNTEQIEDMQMKLRDMRGQMFDIVADIIEMPEEVSDRWQYLNERRIKAGRELARDFTDLEGDLNYILNRCGLDINVKKM